MDINQKDRQALNAKLCPDCGKAIRNFFFKASLPWCKACDVWFETDRSGWVIRNVDATRQYNRKWVEIARHREGYFT
jgi:hypothetical protein